MEASPWIQWLSLKQFSYDTSIQKIIGLWPKPNVHPLMTLLTHEDVLTVRGPDAEKFLQGQLTCDVQHLKENETVLGACCTPKGRIVANFRIFKIEKNHYCLTLPQGQSSILHAHLKKYVIFYKTTLETDHTWLRCGLIGHHDDLSWHNAFSNAVHLFPIHTHGYQIWSTNKEVIWLDKLGQHCTLVPTDVWCLQDMKQGIAWIGPTQSGALIPQEIHWDTLHGINFKKGCYTGQEVIARLHFRGKTKTHMQYFVTSPLPNPVPTYSFINCNIVNKHQGVCGQVLNSLFDPSTQTTHLLAHLRTNQNIPPLKLEHTVQTLTHISLPHDVSHDHTC